MTTLYLLDENVLRESGERGNRRVKAWLATINDDQLRVSAMTFVEKREGWVRHRRKLEGQGKDTTEVDQRLQELAQLEAMYEDRQIPIDFAVGREYAELAGAKNKNQRDVIARRQRAGARSRRRDPQREGFQRARRSRPQSVRDGAEDPQRLAASAPPLAGSARLANADFGIDALLQV